MSQGVVQVAGNATTEAQATVDPIFKPAGGGVAGRPGLHDLYCVRGAIGVRGINYFRVL